MRRHLPALALILAIPLTGVAARTAQDGMPNFWSLMPLQSDAPAGHLVVRVPPVPVAPSEWNLELFVSIYTPKGLRLPLGYVKNGGRVALKLPPGVHAIEITRPASSGMALGLDVMFDLEKGKRTPADQDAVLVGRVSVPVKTNQVHIVSIGFRNPRVVSKKEGNSTTQVYAWESVSLAQTDGRGTDLPTKVPEPYPLLQGMSVGTLDQPHLVAGLEVKESRQDAEMALLHVQKPQLQLILAGMSDKSIALSWSLARVLANTRDSRAVPVLAGTLADWNGKPDGRASAAWALGELGDARGLEALKAALRDPEAMVRNYAVVALGQLKVPGVVPSLAEAMHDTQGYRDGTIFKTAAETPLFYYYTADRSSLFAIKPLPSYLVRINAIYALGQVGDPAAVDLLIGLLADEDVQVRLEALTGLGNYDGPKVIEAMKSRLGDSQSVRFIAVQLLAKRGDASVLGTLDRLAGSDPDTQVREAARNAAARLRKKFQRPRGSKP